jgi:hypothetical protein
LKGVLGWGVALMRDFRRAAVESPRAFLILMLAFLGHVFSALIVYALARVAGGAFHLTDCLLLTPPIMLVAALPISVGGWGVREQAFITGFNLVGVPAVQAVLVSVLFGIIVPAGGLLVVALSRIPFFGLAARQRS